MYTNVTDWKWGIFEGVLLVLLGFFSIFNPYLTTLSISLVIGWILLVAGLMIGWRSFRASKNSDFWFDLLGGIATFILGLVVISQPLSAMLTLTILVILFFLVQGIFNVIAAVKLRKQVQSGWLFLHGIILLLLAAMLWSGWPVSGVFFIGLLFGINLTVSGATLIALSLSMKNRSRTH